MQAPRRGPFDRLRPTVAVAAIYAMAVVVWIALGAELPGGRWLAVHLFTLGVVTNLILAFTDHFARALMHQVGEAPVTQLVATNVGAVAVFVGVAGGRTWWTAAGATALSGVAFSSYRRLRHLRRTAVGARFGWVVWTYELAHGAFLTGALLGALVGTGVLAGPWVGSVRTAHLHVNVLGWAGLTLLATIVFFGPTIARTKIRPRADVRAARSVRFGAIGLAISLLGLVGTAFHDPAGAVARGVAASGLAVFSWSVTVVSVSVIRAGAASQTSERWSILAVGTWFVAAAWADVVVVATGALRLLDAVGAALLVGVLGQAIVAAIGYISPKLLHLDPATASARAEDWARARSTIWNVGVVFVVGAAVIGPTDRGSLIAASGWALVLVALATRVAVVVRAAQGTGSQR